MSLLVSATECLLSLAGPDSDGIPIKRSRRQYGLLETQCLVQMHAGTGRGQ